MTKTTQNQQLLAYLKEDFAISTLVAMRLFGICRLSERIRELEAKGIKIIHEPFKHNGHSFTRYYLQK